jgi:8-oxo-dGTP pyrophosphatase MutT (NUDIX family)
MSGEKRRIREQVGVLPFAIRDGQLRILLLTSRGRGLWLVPKGWPIPGLTAAEAAAREAFEEAGLIGHVLGTEPVGRFRMRKRIGSDLEATCEVTLYPFRVTRQLDDWPERRQRRTRWLAPDAAAELATSPELAALIRGFALSQFAPAPAAALTFR